MRWLVWRQHRWDATSGLAVVIGLGVAMLVVTAASANLLAEIGRACSNTNDQCGSLRADYNITFGPFQMLIFISGVVMPLLVGIFVGAPLMAREYEQGTNLLVWAQGITRRRWFLATVGLIAVGAVAGMALFAGIAQVWLAPQEAVTNLWYSFDVAPLVIVPYTLFALTLGIALGALIQRTLPAMAVTLVIFAAIRGAIAFFVRPYYLPPLTHDIAKDLGMSSAWIVGSLQQVDLSGHQISVDRWNQVLQQCSEITAPSGKVAGPPPMEVCLHEHGVMLVQQYQPDSRFWLFQSIESAIFLALALLLAAVAYRLVMRRT